MNDPRRSLLVAALGFAQLSARRRQRRTVASGQIKLRRIDGGRKIAAVLSQHTAVAA